MKFKLLIILGLFAIQSQAQQLFTTIPSNGYNTYTCVRNVEELNNNYYFLTVSFCFQCPGSNYYEWNLFRTDFNGNILDSLSIMNTNSNDSVSWVYLKKTDTTIILYGAYGPFDSIGHCAQPTFYRWEYNQSLQLIDSFNTNVNLTIPFVSINQIVYNNERIYYFGGIADNTTFTIPTTQIYALDTGGNFLFEKVMPEIRNYIPDAVVNDSTIFITQLIYDSLAQKFRFALSKYNLDMDSLLFRIVDNNLDASNSVLKFNGNRITFINDYINYNNYNNYYNYYT